MPRENRKRGKKHKKQADDNAVHEQHEEHLQADAEPHAGPSWIVSAPDRPEANLEAPFGYVDAEVKAYFRTVDLQIREWQEQGMNTVEQQDEDNDPNEDRRLFFVAALTEMSGKEKQLATDPDCSTVLERMSYSMDDFVRRVFIDRLTGSFEQLSRHRFASHVCQTLFTVASDTVARECRGIMPSAPESSEDGELRTLTQLVLDVSEELLPSLPSLVMDPFASHVVRAFLLLLAPDCLPAEDGHGSSVRSKRSAAYKVKQGSMKSVFSEVGHPEHTVKRTPQTFHHIAKKLVQILREKLDDNEVRALAADKVASPVLQMLVEVEAGLSMADEPGSLMDRALVGLITMSHEDPTATPEASDYLSTLLRDPTASHLLETLVRRAPEEVFSILWVTYFQGKLSKLAVHPVANFVVSKALERANPEQLNQVCEELNEIFGKIIKHARTGVLRALIDRAAALHAHEAQVAKAVMIAFDLSENDDKSLVIPCIMRLLTPADYKTAADSKGDQPNTSGDSQSRRWGRHQAVDDPLEPKVQGAILLQSMLRLAAPHNEVVLESIQAMEMDALLAVAHHPISSRVLDVALESSTVPAKFKRKFILIFLGHYHELVDDRIGSRVGERCWAHADPYLKEKIARSLFAHEHALAGSRYGKFFARSVNLHLLQRNPDQWRDQQSAAKDNGAGTQPGKQMQMNGTKQPAVPSTAASPAVTSTTPGEPVDRRDKKRRRKEAPEDEIDVLFGERLGKKVKKGELKPKDEKSVKSEKGDEVHDERGKAAKVDTADKDLKDVLGAIRAAPKDDGAHRKKKRAR